MLMKNHPKMKIKKKKINQRKIHWLRSKKSRTYGQKCLEDEPTQKRAGSLPHKGSNEMRHPKPSY